MSSKSRKSWQEKLQDSKDLPKVVEISGIFAWIAAHAAEEAAAPWKCCDDN